MYSSIESTWAALIGWYVSAGAHIDVQNLLAVETPCRQVVPGSAQPRSLCVTELFEALWAGSPHVPAVTRRRLKIVSVRQARHKNSFDLKRRQLYCKTALNIQ